MDELIAAGRQMAAEFPIILERGHFTVREQNQFHATQQRWQKALDDYLKQALESHQTKEEANQKYEESIAIRDALDAEIEELKEQLSKKRAEWEEAHSRFISARDELAYACMRADPGFDRAHLGC